MDCICYIDTDLDTGKFIEISEAEASTQPSQLVGAFSGDRLIQKVHLRGESVISVKYFDVIDPSAALAWHSESYPSVIGEAWEPYQRDHIGMHRVGHKSSCGSVEELEIERLDSEGDPVAEERYTPDGRLIERTEYGYDGNKEIVEERIYNRHGVLIDTIRHDE